MRRAALLLLAILLGSAASATQGRARNVVLFVADAGGIPTLNAASAHGHGGARRLFVQQMPYIGLSDTSAAQQLVSDSAAGMTAMATGQRTHNGVIAQSAAAVRGQRDGQPLKTILEYAEERGLATGIVTDDSLAGATPAALYAHTNERDRTGPIFLQLFEPRFGDGVDVAIGAGRAALLSAVAALGRDLDLVARQRQRTVLARLEDIPARARRAIVVHDTEDFDLGAAVKIALRLLARGPNGYFLMVESDVHTDRVRRGLERMVTFDRIIRETAAAVGPDTLVLFTADHSFDLRVHDGHWGQPLLDGLDATQPEPSRKSVRSANVRMDDAHTAEEVLVAAQGPGAQRVHGYMPNTELFSIMMRAYGWPVPVRRAPPR